MTVSASASDQQAVIDAWASMGDWIQNTMPGLAHGAGLPAIRQDAGDFGACNAFNTGDMGGASWGSNGDATVTLSSLSIAALSGVQIQPAVFTQPTVVSLPFSFGKLEVSGSYSYTQPCALYDMGKKTSTSTADGAGTIDQTILNGTLSYDASFSTVLALTGTTVKGDLNAEVHPNDGGLPSWLVALANVLSTFHEADALRTSVANIFTTASFSQTMITILNGKLGGQ
jgi:hypothetical protein